MKLNKIGLKTKEILDALYSNCQLHYIIAVLAFLKADLTIKKKESNSNSNFF